MGLGRKRSIRSVCRVCAAYDHARHTDPLRCAPCAKGRATPSASAQRWSRLACTRPGRRSVGCRIHRAGSSRGTHSQGDAGCACRANARTDCLRRPGDHARCDARVVVGARGTSHPVCDSRSLCAIAHRDAGIAGCGVFWREAARTIGRRSNRSMLTDASTKSVDRFAKRPSVRLWLCRLAPPRRRSQSG